MYWDTSSIVPVRGSYRHTATFHLEALLLYNRIFIWENMFCTVPTKFYLMIQQGINEGTSSIVPDGDSWYPVKHFT